MEQEILELPMETTGWICCHRPGSLSATVTLTEGFLDLSLHNWGRRQGSPLCHLVAGLFQLQEGCFTTAACSL